VAFFFWLARLVGFEDRTMADDLDSTIQQNAEGPKRASGD